MSKTETSLPVNVLTKKEYEILKAATDRLVPEARKVHGLDLAHKIDSVLAGVRVQFTTEMKFLLFILEYGGPLLGFKFKRFTKMTPQEQERYLADWERSPLPLKRTGFQALKRSALAAFYGSEKSWPGIGYRGPWLDKGYPHDYEGKGIQVPD